MANGKFEEWLESLSPEKQAMVRQRIINTAMAFKVRQKDVIVGVNHALKKQKLLIHSSGLKGTFTIKITLIDVLNDLGSSIYDHHVFRGK